MPISDVEILAVRLFTDDMDVYGSADGEFEGIGLVSGVESCTIMFIAGEEALPIQLFRHLL